MYSELLRSYVSGRPYLHVLPFNGIEENIETLWLKTIIQFDMTFFRIFNFEISSQAIFKIMSNNTGFTQRVKISIFLFLQYMTIKKFSEVIQTIIYSLVHNPLHIYTKLYKSFKSSSSGIGNEIDSSRFENSRNEGINKNEKIFSTDDFQKYLQIWKMMYT